ncbi:MAG: AAA family ATPase [Planctomycetota bacterium]|nr:AAA family ATPase [Planctomycetota bacterium]
MAIKKIKVSNFKSFKELDLELGNFNVVIGANASGKSNFVQIFRFIRDIANMGLDNAISLQGSEYVANVSSLCPKSIQIEISFEPTKFAFRGTKSLAVAVNEATYKVELQFEKNGTVFEIKHDEFDLSVDYLDWSARRKRPPEKPDVLASGRIVLSNEGGTIDVRIEKPSELEIKSEDIIPPFWREDKLPPRTILLETPYLLFPPIQRALGNTGLYDFDPKLAKEATPVAGKSELEENGKNLSLVLKNIIETPEKKREFSNLLKDLLPFVEDVKTDKFADRSLMFKLSETYYKDEYFPALFISDGTVNVSALLIALFFEKKNLIIVEEPERNIHPHLVSRLMDMMKDASKNKQIIVTTHSPEVVKHAGLENILLVSRDKNGFSTISRPSEKEEVKIFLKNELGLDEIFVQNLWGA